MITSLWEDIKETIFPTAFAEEEALDAPDASKDSADPQDEEEQANEKDEESKDSELQDDEAEEESGEGDEAVEEDEEEEDEDEDEDEEEDEDELVDPQVTLREKYTDGICHDFKHHFDECTSRVTAAMEQDDYDEQPYHEDCVEEFFHLQHCLDDNVSKVLFSKLR